MRSSSLAVICSVLGVFATVEALGQPSPAIPVPSPPGEGESEAGRPIRLELGVTDPRVSDALVDLIEKITKKAADEGPRWYESPLTGAFLGALLPLLGVLLSNRATARREKKTMEHELTKDEANRQYEKGMQEATRIHEGNMKERQHRLEKEKETALAEVHASLDTARDSLSSSKERLAKFFAPLYWKFEHSRRLADNLAHEVFREKSENRWNDPKQYGFLSEDEEESGADPVVPEPDDGKKRRLYVRCDRGWVRWRTLDYMALLKDNPRCRPFVEKIIEVGRQKVQIITEHAGLAATGQLLSPLYGEYLSHFSVLEQTFETPPDKLREPESARGLIYYPRGVDNVVRNDYEAAFNAVVALEARLLPTHTRV